MLCGFATIGSCHVHVLTCVDHNLVGKGPYNEASNQPRISRPFLYELPGLPVWGRPRGATMCNVQRRDEMIMLVLDGRIT